VVKSFSIGLILGVVLVGCVSVSFPYRWYYPSLNSYEGTLLGDKPSNDLDASQCARNGNGGYGCIVMLKSEFKAMYNDYLETKQRLIDLERRCGQ
jgi:hypothetical protein